MPSPKQAIGIFCGRYGLDYRTVVDHRESPYDIVDADPDRFDGRVVALRIHEYGRLGNRFYQLLNAMLLARHLGCHEVQMPRIDGGALQFPVELPGMRLVLTAGAAPVGPTLAGHFFTTNGFEPILEPLHPGFVDDTLRRFVRPAFAASDTAPRPEGDDEMVVVFRAGKDIFPDSGPVHPYYVQPPAAFYLAVIAHARAALGVAKVVLVGDDRRNPAVEPVEAFLGQQGIPFHFQAAGAIEDLGRQLRARHLVIPFTTFGEAAALLSARLKSYFAFRDAESHAFAYRRAYSILEAVLTWRGVALHVVEDVDGGYIPRAKWNNSAEQRALIRNYPTTALRITRRPVPPVWDHDTRPRALLDALAAARREGAALDQALAQALEANRQLQRRLDEAARDYGSLATVVREFGMLPAAPQALPRPQ